MSTIHQGPPSYTARRPAEGEAGEEGRWEPRHSSATVCPPGDGIILMQIYKENLHLESGI